MPGLLRGIARTAAVAGTATAVSNRVSRRQGGRWAKHDAQSQPAAAGPVAAAAPAPDRLGQLKQLGELRDSGVLTEAEFQQQKAQLLSS
jgi:Short C-terminal domain